MIVLFSFKMHSFDILSFKTSQETWGRVVVKGMQGGKSRGRGVGEVVEVSWCRFLKARQLSLGQPPCHHPLPGTRTPLKMMLL